MEKSGNKYNKIADKKYEPVGNFINYYIHNNKVNKAQLARDLGILPTTLNQYFKQNSLQFGILWKISKALNHNFIAQLAEYLHSDEADAATRLRRFKMSEKVNAGKTGSGMSSKSGSGKGGKSGKAGKGKASAAKARQNLKKLQTGKTADVPF